MAGLKWSTWLRVVVFYNFSDVERLELCAVSVQCVACVKSVVEKCKKCGFLRPVRRGPKNDPFLTLGVFVCKFVLRLSLQ